MIRFVVEWSDEANDALARIWTRARDRRAVSAADQAIEAELSVDAHIKGKACPADLRELEVYPLRVLFAFNLELKHCYVLTLTRLPFPINGQPQRPEGSP